MGMAVLPEIKRPFGLVIMAIVLPVAAYVVWASPALSVLTFVLAAVMNPALDWGERKVGSRTAAFVIAVLAVFGVFLASIALVVVPLTLTLIDVINRFPEIAEAWVPRLRELAFDVETALAASPIPLGDFNSLESASIDLLGQVLASDGFASFALGVLLTPVQLFTVSLVVLILAAFALGYWTSLARGGRKVLEQYVPHIAPRLLDVLARFQHNAKRVFLGYATVVCVLMPIFLVFFLLVRLIFGVEGLTLLNSALMTLFFAVIAAVPGLGAKIGSVLVTSAGLMLSGFDIAASITFFLFGIAVTSLESKVLTPSRIGAALGLNSCLLLFIALLATVVGGIGITLWTVFVLAPLVVALHQSFSEYPTMTGGGDQANRAGSD